MFFNLDGGKTFFGDFFKGFYFSRGRLWRERFVLEGISTCIGGGGFMHRLFIKFYLFFLRGELSLYLFSFSTTEGNFGEREGDFFSQ